MSMAALNLMVSNITRERFGKKITRHLLGCPCKVQKCIEHCSSEYDFNYFLLDFIAKTPLILLDLVEFTKNSLNATRQMVLNYYYLYSWLNSEKGDRKAIKVQGSGWNTQDFFYDFSVINEAKYVNAQNYILLTPVETSLDQLERACFTFAEDNQVNIAQKSCFLFK